MLCLFLALLLLRNDGSEMLYLATELRDQRSQRLVSFGLAGCGGEWACASLCIRRSAVRITVKRGLESCG